LKKAWTYRYQASNCSSVATLHSFLVASAHANGMRNRQTRMLAGAKLEPRQVEKRTEEELYPVALEHLSDGGIDFAFVIEHFDLGLLLLSQRLGIPPPSRYQVVKERAEASPLPPQAKHPWIVAAVENQNKFDTALHTHATEQLLAWGREAGLVLTETGTANSTTYSTNDPGAPLANSTSQVGFASNKDEKLRKTDVAATPWLSAKQFYSCKRVASHQQLKHHNKGYYVAAECKTTGIVADSRVFFDKETNMNSTYKGPPRVH